MCEHDVPIEYCGTTKCEITRLRSRVEELEKQRNDQMRRKLAAYRVVDGVRGTPCVNACTTDPCGVCRLRDAVWRFDAEIAALTATPSPPTEVGGKEE